MKENPIDRLKIVRYDEPENVGGFTGLIEPEDKSWILWFNLEGRPCIYNPRREADGGVIEIDPLDRQILHQ